MGGLIHNRMFTESIRCFLDVCDWGEEFGFDAFNLTSFDDQPTNCYKTETLQYSFIPAISIAPLQVHYYSESLPTTARILYRRFTPKRTGNCR